MLQNKKKLEKIKLLEKQNRVLGNSKYEIEIKEEKRSGKLRDPQGSNTNV